VLEGIVYLVGAGPGDPGLITVKGIRCLEKADVIVYDRLVNPQLLSFASPEAGKIFMGKETTGLAGTQDGINSLLIGLAREGKTVVRLKGGDPFIFGRGGEEAEALAEAGVHFEVVPGVTSAVAAPAYAGIPLTHRSHASSVTIVTGNEDPDKENSLIAWDKIAAGSGTLVFLMGMANLKAVCGQLIKHGRNGNTPAALIRWGTWAEQEFLQGTLADIASQAERENFKNPAVIVIGDVVGLYKKLWWLKKKPLTGRRILVTREAQQAEGLARLLTEQGGEVIVFPTIAITGPNDSGPLDQALDKIGRYNWIIFTSKNGVKYFFKRMNERLIDIRDLKGIKLAAIGPKTRETLEECGLRVALTPPVYIAEEIVASIKTMIKTGDRILLPRSDKARKFLKEALAGLGAEVEDVIAYRTRAAGGDPDYLRRMLGQGFIHLIIFASPSAVYNFVQLLDVSDLTALMKNVQVACIGPVTAQAAAESGLRADIVAREYTSEGLIEAILKSN
jgi:uroporphyrinogen III methyltransferase/synthase